MGEAWFIGEKRRLYPELYGDLDDVETSVLEDALIDIASGTSSFGTMVEWRDWFHYLMPRLVPRAARDPGTTLSELLVTAFASQHPLGIDEIYRGFGADVLATLGRMAILQEVQAPPPRPETLWTGGLSALSSGLVFQCKYQSEDDLEQLIDALLSTRDPFRRAERLAWLVGAHSLLCGIRRSPSDTPVSGYPVIDWEWSHCLRMESLCPNQPCETFVSSRNGNLVVAKATSVLAGDGLLDWIETMEVVPELSGISWLLLDRAFDLYGSPENHS